MESSSEPKDYDKLIQLHEKFTEFEEVKAIIESLPQIQNDITQIEVKLDRFQFITNRYQEQPHLLDPHLEILLNSLLNYLRVRNTTPNVQNLACKLLFMLTKTRGYKIIVRYLPHEVSDVEFVLSLLLSAQNLNSLDNWETRYMLLLWLSMVCMIPFEMSRLDGQIDASSSKKPIVDRIIDAVQQYLDKADKCRDAAVYTLAKFLTRPDTSVSHLPAVIDRYLITMETMDRSSLYGQLKLCGYLAFFASVFKYGKREALIGFVPTVLHRINGMKLDSLTNCLLRKLNMKLIQRLGLTLLKPKVASWRYKRGLRSVVDTLKQSEPGQSAPSSHGDLPGKTDDDDEEDYDIPDDVEDVTGSLLNGLKDRDTVVRWSAAKGVGRVASRLPSALAAMIASSVLTQFSEAEGDTAWHGGCLALAEMARRGLILPSSLGEVVKVVLKALVYDELRGNFSVGAHVRDSACYVCWSLARAYDPQDIAPHVTDIANALVIVTLFDREIGVRRAASAAFQENVGRQGQFPHGIDILTTCDYFAVGIRKNCYLDLSVFVAGFSQYTLPVIEHLVTSKTSHWDSEIRELSAQALARLTPLAVEYVSKKVLPQVLTHCRHADSNVRHGNILAAAHITQALATLAAQTDRNLASLVGDRVVDDLVTLTSKFPAELFVGLSGVIMRTAVCVYIDKLLLSHIDTTNHPEIVRQWHTFLNDCLELELRQDDVREAALPVLPHLISEYFASNAPMQDRIVADYSKKVRATDIEMVRQGFCRALGCLPACVLQGRMDVVMATLTDAAFLSPSTAKWALARRDAMTSLGSVMLTYGKAGIGDAAEFDLLVAAFFKMAFSALQDYESDDKGDIGAWVREAAMSAMCDVTSWLLKSSSASVSSDLYVRVLAGLVQQACERIDRTRELAGRLFSQLLYVDCQVPYANVQSLKAVVTESIAQSINWAVPADTFPLFVRFLTLPDFTNAVALGFTLSTGGWTESVSRHSSTSLLSYLQDEPGVIPAYLDALMAIFQTYKKVNRVTLPMLKQLDMLFNSGCLVPLPEPQGPQFVIAAFNYCKEEIQKASDPNKLTGSISVFCDLLQYTSVQNKCLSQLAVFLCHKFPLVRRTAAGRLYESLMTLDELLGEDDMGEVLALLGDTDWSCPVPEVKVTRNRLCDLLKIPVPVPVSADKPQN